ncbi:hypothetical protein, conserved [Trypanosoma brucei gambiense DAL972]|uniref:T. brucei spp.-specific protein n=2 Tax=Trypanosoma brucei TaxID=5691 RepID=C9ZSH6_TRYB9|nr:hypothetical protein, conserved [Trypanosoma brucei gambiense DAL972]RHW71238.1 hypothetical protein DPX39_070035500 [Trypanosoma brucei equiperdum]CBH12360.1 hypothetical protein, conserved [Trypanosoma brucei gambiense DAL972]|eukprot:XP_011774641.1 hypothetical protein, conserved [Trypanosoma brucei gambiense DAL972]
MHRRTFFLFLFSKPLTQGYVAQLPQPAPTARRTAWRRCFETNKEVRDMYTPNAERYDEWYRETYGLEDISDGCAASGASSNRLLNDDKNLSETADVEDLRAAEEEVEWCSRQFNHNTLVR